MSISTPSPKDVGQQALRHGVLSKVPVKDSQHNYAHLTGSKMQAQSSHLLQDPTVHHKCGEILNNKGWDCHDVLLVYLSFTQQKAHGHTVMLFHLSPYPPVIQQR